MIFIPMSQTKLASHAQKKLKVKELLKNHQGQTLMEYMILAGLVGALCLVSVRNFGESIKSKLEQATQKINKTIVIR